MFAVLAIRQRQNVLYDLIFDNLFVVIIFSVIVLDGVMFPSSFVPSRVAIFQKDTTLGDKAVVIVHQVAIYVVVVIFTTK